MTSMGRVAVSSAVAVLILLANACSGANKLESISTSVAAETPATTSPSGDSTTTSLNVWSDEVGLFRVDPATLVRLPGVAPITTGDWISGVTSDNGEWLALNVWIDTEPDTDVVRVVEVSSGRVVTDSVGPLMHELRVGNDGTVYNHFQRGSCGGRVGALRPGATEFVTVFDAFPAGFCSLTPMTLLDDERVGWLGVVPESDSDGQRASLLIGDLSSGSASVVDVSAVGLGLVGEQDMGDWVIVETLQPAVVWDKERNQALVIHADEPSVSVADLISGEVTTHAVSEQTSWISGLFAWLVPAAEAKGPESVTSKTAALSVTGDTLYVGTQGSKVVVADDGEWTVEAVPEGVDVIDTDSWEVIARFDIPASQVSLSPSGSHLVAAGVATIDTLSTSRYDPQGAFIIDTESLDVVGQVATPGEWYPDIQYSADGAYLYLGRLGGGPIRIVDLATGQETATIADTDQLTVFGEAAMLSTTSQP